MNCNLNKVIKLIFAAIAALGVAMALAHFWVAALPLFAAAALVASVSFYFIPHIKQALLDYATCRGQTKCTLSLGINNLGQVTIVLSLVVFALAGAMQIAALGFIFSFFLSWLGLAMQVAVAALVSAGFWACLAAIGILLGVLANAYGYKGCVDSERTFGEDTLPPSIH